jgi:hypothetical protein
MPPLLQTCHITGKTFRVTEWEQEFLRKMGDIPPPTLHIEERHRRRLAFRNERCLYSDTCDLCKKPMVSLYNRTSPHAKASKYTVYCQPCWWSDNWDTYSYGKDMDFSQPFFPQFKELSLKIPKIALVNTNSENSEYCNPCMGNKNCYLVFGGDYNEDCYYSIFNFYTKNCCDVFWCNKGELLYDVSYGNGSYNVQYAYNAENCTDSMFLYNCRNLKNCFGCVNLNNKEYHLFNKPVKPEEYQSLIDQFQLHSHTGVQQMKQQFETFRLRFPQRATRIISCENVSGDRIFNTKNAQNCFEVTGPAEDIKDCMMAGWDLKDSMSLTHGGFKSELLYEICSNAKSYNGAFSAFCYESKNYRYSNMILNSSYIFGSDGIHRGEYIVLNKKYSESEYHELVGKIIAHMKSTGEYGEFFPMSMSPFSYNETIANDIYPLSKETVQEMGLTWHQEETRPPQSSPDIPDSIHDVTDDILKKTLICQETGRPYRIQKQELSFYRKMNIPLPRFHFETRNRNRLKKVYPYTLYQRECEKCNISISSPFQKSRPETIYCESCYQKEVY